MFFFLFFRYYLGGLGLGELLCVKCQSGDFSIPMSEMCTFSSRTPILRILIQKLNVSHFLQEALGQTLFFEK